MQVSVLEPAPTPVLPIVPTVMCIPNPISTVCVPVQQANKRATPVPCEQQANKRIKTIVPENEIVKILIEFGFNELIARRAAARNASVEESINWALENCDSVVETADNEAVVEWDTATEDVPAALNEEILAKLIEMQFNVGIAKKAAAINASLEASILWALKNSCSEVEGVCDYPSEKKMPTSRPAAALEIILNKEESSGRNGGGISAVRDENEVVELLRTCDICLESHKQGIECNNSTPTHFYCLECFQGGYANNQLSPEYRQQFKAHGCKFSCRCCEPRVILLKGEEREIVNLLGNEGFLKYSKVREEIAQLNAVEELRIQLRQQIQKEIEDEMHAERRVARHRLLIIENILTLHCPRCKSVIHDFEGCFAVRHNKDLGGCGCSFCAWCLLDCGKDAHPHVRKCKLNPRPGSLGDSAEDEADLKRVQNERRQASILKYILDSVQEEDREKVAKAIEGDLRHLDMMPLDTHLV